MLAIEKLNLEHRSCSWRKLPDHKSNHQPLSDQIIRLHTWSNTWSRGREGIKTGSALIDQSAKSSSSRLHRQACWVEPNFYDQNAWRGCAITRLFRKLGKKTKMKNVFQLTLRMQQLVASLFLHQKLYSNSTSTLESVGCLKRWEISRRSIYRASTLFQSSSTRNRFASFSHIIAVRYLGDYYRYLWREFPREHR